jgi:hypothetical protein
MDADTVDRIDMRTEGVKRACEKKGMKRACEKSTIMDADTVDRIGM